MSDKMSDKYLVKTLRDMRDGQRDTYPCECLKVDLDGNCWLRPDATPIKVQSSGGTYRAYLQIDQTAGGCLVVIVGTPQTLWARGPLPELPKGCEWIKVSEIR